MMRISKGTVLRIEPNLSGPTPTRPNTERATGDTRNGINFILDSSLAFIFDNLP